MGNIHTVGPNEALIVSGKSINHIKTTFFCDSGDSMVKLFAFKRVFFLIQHTSFYTKKFYFYLRFLKHLMYYLE